MQLEILCYLLLLVGFYCYVLIIQIETLEVVKSKRMQRFLNKMQMQICPHMHQVDAITKIRNANSHIYSP